MIHITNFDTDVDSELLNVIFLRDYQTTATNKITNAAASV